jgi:membrane-associated protease RseP (regulator of RpoE activity)
VRADQRGSRAPRVSISAGLVLLAGAALWLAPASVAQEASASAPKKAPKSQPRPGGSSAEFDRRLAPVWVALVDVKVASEYAESILKDSAGFRVPAVGGVLKITHDAFKEARKRIGPAPDKAHRRIAEEVAHSAGLVDRYVDLVTKAIAAAQAAGSWSGDPERLFSQAQAILPGVDWSDETWRALKQSRPFVEALPLEERVQRGLAQDPAGFDLGARALDRDPKTVLVVREDSLAEQLGLEPGDRLVSVDGAALASLWELKKVLAARTGARIELVTERKDKSRRRKIKVPDVLGQAADSQR